MQLLRSAICLITVMGAASLALAVETPFAGTWKLNPSKSQVAGSPSLLVISDADNGVIFDDPDFRLKAIVAFDRKPGTVVDPTSAPGASVLLTRMGKHTFEMTRTQNGKPLDTSTWTVSPNGKVLKSIIRTAGTNDPPTTQVFDKQ